MLRESAKTTVPDDAPPPKKQTHEDPFDAAQGKLLEERLDLILEYMHRFERRDRWRTIGSTIRNLIAIIPLLVFLGSLWYVYVYGEDLLQKFADEAARSAAKYSQESAEGWMEQLEQYLPKGAQTSSRR
jgi:hypothetical protein